MSILNYKKVLKLSDIDYRSIGMEILTTLMPWRWAFIAKARAVEMMTDKRGAPAETQNNCGFFMLYTSLVRYNLLSTLNLFGKTFS